MRSLFKSLARRLPALLICALILGAAPLLAAPLDHAPAEHVVMISLDGLPAYLVDDPKVSMPNIHALAKRGVHASMRVSNPSVTWPNHTTLMTGVQPRRHGVLANGMLVRGGPGIPVTIEHKHDRSELVRTATLFDVAHAAGLTTAAMQWPCTRGDTAIDDNFPDVSESKRYTTPRLLDELIADGALPADIESTLHAHSAPWYDNAWTTATGQLIARRKPNLLLLHLGNSDGVHHQYGPQTPAGYTAVAYADACVGRLVVAIDAAGIRDSTAVFVVSDHGFIATEKALLPNSLLRKEGWLRSTPPNKIEEARVSVVPEGGVALLYFTDPTLDAAARQKVRDLFIGREGIVGVIEPEQYAEYGFPDVRDWPQMADMVLVAEEGYCFVGAADDERWIAPATQVGASIGNHGFLATNPKMNAAFVAAGAGLRSGVELGGIDNVDVAPTVAHLLGITLPDTDGHLLAGALSEAKP